MRRIGVVNRGEAAVRFFSTLGVLRREDPTAPDGVALYTDADAGALFVRQAPLAARLGADRAAYLDAARVTAALRETECDAAWLGWGFAAENADFVAALEAAGVTIVGPGSEAIRVLGDKASAKRLARELGVPHPRWAAAASPAEASAVAAALGYPVLLKASLGGGGRGIRAVHAAAQLPAAWSGARDEAARLFGAGELFVEELICPARHVEVQILGDGQGGIVPFGVRDCSLQRQRQKVIEECPSPGLPPERELAIIDDARRLCAAVRYRSAGTVEFLYDPVRDRAVFLEVNTRLQVEHPITEEVFGVDLVREQIELARGRPLPERAPQARGWAFEARICAEDPDRSFLPSPGRLLRFELPTGPGIRVDSGFSEGDLVSPTFDSLLAKVISWGPTRAAALARLEKALDEIRIVVDGGLTNCAFLRRLTREPAVRQGRATVDTVEALPRVPADSAPIATVVAAIERYKRRELELLNDAVRLQQLDGELLHKVDAGGTFFVYHIGPQTYRVTDGVRSLSAVLQADGPYQAWLTLQGSRYRVERAPGDPTYLVDSIPTRIAGGQLGVIEAASPAVVLSVAVAPGSDLTAGQTVAVLESMKMEMRIAAPGSGRVREVCVTPGAHVAAGQVLMTLDSADAPVAAELPRLPWDDEETTPAAAARRIANGILGWDIDAALFEADLRRLTAVGASEILTIFADLTNLFDRRPAAQAEHPYFGRPLPNAVAFDVFARRGAEYVGARYRRLLRRVLARYGVGDLHPARDLRRAITRLRRAASQLPTAARAACAAIAAADTLQLGLLGELAALDIDRFGAVVEAADRKRFVLFERPAFLQLERHAEARALYLLDRLRHGEDRWSDLLQAPESLFPTLARRAIAGCFVAAEAVARRFERDRPGARCRLIAAASRLAFRIDDEVTSTVSAVCRPGEVADMLQALASERGLSRLDLAIVPATTSPSAGADALLLQEATEALRAHVEALGGAEPREYCLVLIREQGPPWVRRFDGRGAERQDRRDVLPIAERQFNLERLREFELVRLTGEGETLLFLGRARSNPSDTRLFAYAEVRSLERAPGRRLRLPHLDRAFHEAVRSIQLARQEHDPGGRLRWNRLTLRFGPVIDVPEPQIRAYALRLGPATDRIGLEKVFLRARFADPKDPTNVSELMDLAISNPSGHRLELARRPASQEPLAPHTGYESRVVNCRRRNLVYPYEIVRMLTLGGALPPGAFQEMDLAAGRPGLCEVTGRAYGENHAGVVVGIVTSRHERIAGGLQRVLILSDPTRAMGALAEAECRRVEAALDLAEARGIPVEWVPVSSGARIDWETGTENLDWTARVLARIVRFTQAGGEINIIVAGVCVGAQSYWNAEATMMMHSRGLLIMTSRGSMVLTGKRALDFSGSVSAEDEIAIGGFAGVMGQNGQAQAYAPDLGSAYRLLYHYYDLTYLPQGVAGRLPPAPTADQAGRDIGRSAYPTELGHGFERVGDIFSDACNPGRRKPFAIRPVMAAVADFDCEPIERWGAMRDAESAVTWETRIGGRAVALIGIESQALPRLAERPVDGPDRWGGGTLYPQSSRKVARMINAASGRRPVVVLANLSGFDGSPDSLRSWQLEYGAEIGRAVVNFRGALVFAVISRYHGGAYVVFSQALNPGLVTVALEGSYASVIGGAPAAAVVFDAEVRRLAHERGGGDAAYAAAAAEIGARFDKIHSVERALRVGSVSAVIEPSRLRPFIIEALVRAEA